MLLYHQIFAIAIQFFVGGESAVILFNPRYLTVLRSATLVLLIVRTYALYNRNRWVLGTTAGYAISGASVACVSGFVNYSSPHIGVPGSAILILTGNTVLHSGQS